jgi:tetratricopeptide (TPR) repeat protein/uncharacterized caspase-like protein
MATKLYLLAIASALLAVPASAQSRQDAKTWAVVIGISKYQKLPGGQQLQFAARDATTFTEAIEKRGVSPQDVRLFTGSEATAAAIKSAIGNWLARAASESDTVLIFFSGHGLFEREFGESYLLAYDSDPKDPYGTALSIGELTQALTRRVRSGRVLVIADAVRRDFFDPESDPNSAALFEQGFDQLASSRPGVSAIIASGPGEFSREGERWGGRGVFTKHLADVLFDGADKNGNLALATGELFDLLKGRVADDTSGKQHPWRSGTAAAQRDVARVERQPTPNVASPSKPGETKNPSGARAQDLQHPAPSQPPKQEPVPRVSEKKIEPPAHAVNEKKAEINSANVSGAAANSNAPPKPGTTSSNATPKPAPAKPSPPRASTPPATEPVRGARPETAPPREPARSEVAVRLPAAPKPTVNPPSTVAVSSDRAANQPEAVSASVPIARPEAAPLPLVLQLEAAIASKNLTEPRNTNAWEYYQRLTSDPAGAADAARLKPLLAEALTGQGRSIVSGDVRGDNVSERVDDFKRAGQMLARARSLAPDNRETSALEKLSAAEALLALQFYDEAERALAQLEGAKLAAVDNALGLVYQGKLDTFRAERAFKRAIEIDSKWAAPHYNLAMLYRSQQNQASLAELEAAASLDSGNVNLLGALGEEYFTRQQWKQATETFRKAIALKPSDDNLHTKLGHSLYSQGLQEEANREYQKARELRAKQP